MFLLDADTTALLFFASDGGRLCANNGKTVTTSANPLYPTAEDSYMQPADRSAAQARLGVDYLAATHSLALSWPRLPVAESTAFRAFFRTGARGRANRFVRLDARGAVTSGRFTRSTIDCTEHGAEMVEISAAYQEE